MEKVKFKVVIGSWGSYNECNERALGSKWLNFAEFDTWEEIEEELIKEGFELEGIDEELFIQDISEDMGFDCDYMHPQRLFNILNESEILKSDYYFEKALAFIEAYGWNDFVQLVEEWGDSWDCDVCYYSGYDWEELGKEIFEEMGYNLPDYLENYFDFERYGEDLSDEGYIETFYGIIFRY